MKRTRYLQKIQAGFKKQSVVILLGPSQCGTTRLATRYAAEQQQVTRFDLEDHHDANRLMYPEKTLQDLSGLILINDIQRRMDVLSIIISAAKKKPQQQYLLVGHATHAFIQEALGDSFANVVCVEVTPLTLIEIDNAPKAWLRGGLPKSYCSDSDELSYQWRVGYIARLLERDVPNLGYHIKPDKLHRFWSLLAHAQARVLNTSEIARAMGVSNVVVRRYLDVLSSVFMLRLLQPWKSATTKRQVKTPKVYCRDSGVLHALLQLPDRRTLLQSTHVSASWEGSALESIIHYYDIPADDCYFWATHQGAGVDLLFEADGQRLGFCFCYAGKVKLMRSMRIALEDLELDRLWVVSPGGAKSIELFGGKVYSIGLMSLFA